MLTLRLKSTASENSGLHKKSGVLRVQQTTYFDDVLRDQPKNGISFFGHVGKIMLLSLTRTVVGKMDQSQTKRPNALTKKTYSRE